jgi:hypothetical protein
MAITLGMLDSRFVIECDDSRLEELIGELWGPFHIDADAGEATPVVVETTDSGWRCTLAEREVLSTIDPWMTVIGLRTGLDEHALAHAEGIVDFHAAVVVHGEAVVALPGGPGAGKTSLALALLQRGWSLMCDDIAPLRATGEVTPYPRPFGIRNVGDAWEHLAQLWDVPAWLPAPRGPFLLPAKLFELATPGDRAPTRLLFPEFRAGADPGVVDLTPAEAMARCGAHVRPLDPPTLALIGRVCERAPAQTAVFGDAASFADFLGHG